MAIEKQINIDVNATGFDDATSQAKSLSSEISTLTKEEIALTSAQLTLEASIDKMNRAIANGETDLRSYSVAVSKAEINLKELTEKSEDLARGQNDVNKSVLDNGGAMGLLNDVTGGLAMTIKDAVEATDLFSRGTKANTVVQTISNTVIGASTGLLKAFRIALAATGIGLIVIALVALIANFEKVSEWLKNLIPGFGAIASAIGEVIDMVTDFIGVTSEAQRQMDKMVEKSTENMQRNKEAMDAYGDKYDEFTKRKMDANDKYNQHVIDLAKDETKTDKEKLALLKLYRERANRDILDAENDREDALDKKRKDRADKAKADAEKATKDAATAKENAFKKEMAVLDEQFKIEKADNIRKNIDNTFNEYQYLQNKLALYKKYGKDLGDIQIGIAESEKEREKQKNDFLAILDKATADAKIEDKKQEEADIQAVSDDADRIRKEKRDKKAADEAKHKDQLKTLYSETSAAFLAASQIFGEGTKEQMALQEASLQIAKITADGKIDALEAVGAASSVAAKAAGEATGVGKALGIASATIDTYKGIMAIWGAKSMGNPIVDVAVKTASSAIVAAQGIMSIKKILAVKVPGASTPTGGVPSPTTTQAPQFNVVGQSSENQLASTIAERQGQPMKTYVVANEVSTAQSLDRNIINNATFI